MTQCIYTCDGNFDETHPTLQSRLTIPEPSQKTPIIGQDDASLRRKE